MMTKNQIMRTLLFLVFVLHVTSAVKHSLQYFYTAVTPGINFPQFTIVGLVDQEQFVYYDSNIEKMTPKTEWIKKVVGDEAGYWDIQTQNSQGNEETYKVNVDTLMQRFNQTGGVHTVQVMYGCELDDDGTKRGYNQHGYDGEDFLVLDLNTQTWTAANQRAVITKQRWDATGADANFQKNYLENTCIEWLQKYVSYGRETLERKVPPKTDLFQKDSSSPLVCHATGFFPKEVMMSWQKDGEEVHEDVELRETVPNPDGTFQKRSILTVSPEELKKNKYSCVIEHSGVKKEIPLSDIRVLNEVKNGEEVQEDVELRETVPNEDRTLQRRTSLTVSPEERKNKRRSMIHDRRRSMKEVKNGEEVHEDVELRETVPNEDGTLQRRTSLTVSPEQRKNKRRSMIRDRQRSMKGGCFYYPRGLTTITYSYDENMVLTKTITRH